MAQQVLGSADHGVLSCPTEVNHLTTKVTKDTKKSVIDIS
jgi:hypothetical protein